LIFGNTAEPDGPEAAAFDVEGAGASLFAAVLLLLLLAVVAAGFFLSQASIVSPYFTRWTGQKQRAAKAEQSVKVG